ncbi:MAG: hypothetical protein K2Z80_02460 [Xanthobacteraceae bacterium]|nr:hypothetical protein [Xanthobacteraceae bacterium]
MSRTVPSARCDGGGPGDPPSRLFKQFGAPADERLNDVTVEELLVHRAGGRGNADIPGPDYLAFLDIFDPAHAFLSDGVKVWIDRAQTRGRPPSRPPVQSRHQHLGRAAGRFQTAAS